MATEVSIKKGDTSRKLTDTLTLDGSAINLTGGSVVLVWRDQDGTVSRKTATIASAVDGEVEYQLLTADVADAQRVLLEWEITFADTTVLTVPTMEFIVLNILDDLG
jgi:hypothetical protein